MTSITETPQFRAALRTFIEMDLPPEAAARRHAAINAWGHSRMEARRTRKAERRALLNVFHAILARPIEALYGAHALRILRAIEIEAAKVPAEELRVPTTPQLKRMAALFAKNVGTDLPKALGRRTRNRR